MAYPSHHPDAPSSAPTSMSRADFRRAYPGESDHVEFKQGVSAERIKEAVTAFSNHHGGVVMIGVTPAGTVHGTNVDGEARARLHQIVASVRDSGRYDLGVVDVEARSVAVIAVRARREGFAQMPDGRVLVRRGAMNVALMGADLAEFVQSRSLRRFESTPVGVDLSAASDDRLAAVREAWGWTHDVPARLVEQRLAVDEGGRTRLTVAGALYLLRDPSEALGKAYVEIFRYRDDGSVEDRREQIRGPLDVQVAKTTEWLRAELGQDIVILGLHRHELDRLPVAVLREAVANAVAHRSYEDPRRAVRIEVRPTRVTVASPGPLPEPVTVENIREQNAPRNVDVIATLRRFKLAEDAGRGIDVMEDTMAANLLDRPLFVDDGSTVTVNLSLTSTMSSRERAWVTEIQQAGRIRPEDKVLLVHAARGQVLTNARVRSITGWDSVAARASLQRLRDADLLRQEGERAGARYYLRQGLLPPAVSPLTRAEIEEVVLRMASDGPVTNESVREGTALDRAQALTVLQGLVEDGRLVMVGERRGTRYVLPQDAGDQP